LPEGIDAYAINLEFNLGGNAQKVIGDMVSSLTKIEQKLGDVAKQFSNMKFGDGIGKGVDNTLTLLDQFEEMVKAIDKQTSSISFSPIEADLERLRALQEKRLELAKELKAVEEKGNKAIANSELTQEAMNKQLAESRDKLEDIDKLLADKLPKDLQK